MRNYLMPFEICLDSILVTDNRVDYTFRCGDALAPYFWETRILTLESTMGIKDGSDSDLASSFYFALAPICWMFGGVFTSRYPINSNIKSCLNAVGEYLSTFYEWTFTDAFHVLTVVENESEVFTMSKTTQTSALMFSGGIDSCAALVSKKNSINSLIHLSNFDYVSIYLNPSQNQKPIMNARSVANHFGLNFVHVETNLANVINHSSCDTKFPKRCTFWYGLQHVHHIMTAISILKPEFTRVFLAGSFDKLHKILKSCAASSDFISHYSWGTTSMQLLDENMWRQHKIELLLDTDRFLLSRARVCFTSGEGTCADCKKCQGTALMVLAAGGRLGDTEFPHSILEELRGRLRMLSPIKRTSEILLEHALCGRALSGNRPERITQLIGILSKEIESK